MSKASNTSLVTEERGVPSRVIAAIEKQGGFETLLPAPYRSMAQRMLARAQLYIANSSNRVKIQQCTVASLATAVLEAGAMGLPIDGKMAHIVPFNCKVKGPDGREIWESRATFMPDYKGIVCVARRHATIVDCFAHHVFKNDIFHRAMIDGVWKLEYEPAQGDRGAYLGTFAVVLFAEKRFVVEYMVESEIEAIRKRSKAANDGPWVTDWFEMAKKTVLKRIMKLYADDPEVLDLLDKDNVALGYEDADIIDEPPRKIGARKSEPLRLGSLGGDADIVGAAGQEEEPSGVTEEQPKRGAARERQAPEAEVESSDPVEYWRASMLKQTSRAEVDFVWQEAEADQSMDQAQTAKVKGHYEKIRRNLPE